MILLNFASSSLWYKYKLILESPGLHVLKNDAWLQNIRQMWTFRQFSYTYYSDDEAKKVISEFCIVIPLVKIDLNT